MRQLILVAVFLALVVGGARAQVRPATALAPILVEPYDGKDVSDQQIVWSWFMQSSASNGEEIICDLTVVEILEGQSAEEAMRVNPPVLLRKNLTVATWQTTALSRSLLHGRRYTWQVTAKVRRRGGGAERVVSQSELWEFTYNDPSSVAEETGGDVTDLSQNEQWTPDDSSGVTVNDTLLPSGTGNPEDPTSTSLEEDLAATDTASPVIKLSGEARYTYATENRRGNLSTAPVRFDRLQLEPTITVFDVPLDLSVLLTTEKNLKQSDISRGAFGTKDVARGLNLAVQQRLEKQIDQLEQARDSARVDSLRAFVSSDSAAIAQRIAELERLDELDVDESLEALQELNLLSPEQEKIALFPSFGFGAVAPSFGSLLFDRVTINGGAIEYNPDNFYVAGAVGKSQRTFDPSFVPEEVFRQDSALLANPEFATLELHRNIYSARIGYGRRRASYIAVTGFYADDDDQSRALQAIFNRPVTKLVERVDSAGEVVGVDTVLQSNTIVGRQRNYGIGGAARLQEEELGLTLDGEFNLMYFDDDANRASQILIPLPQALPDVLRTDSSLADINFVLRGDWELPIDGAGSLNAGVKYVGGGYRSVGLAGLRADVLRADAHYRTLFLDRQVRVGLNYSFEEAGYKDSSNTSVINALGANVDIRFRGWPTLGLSYMQHAQNLETSKRDPVLRRVTDNAIEQFSAVLAYLNQWGDMRWSMFASGLMRDGRSVGSDTTSLPDSAGVFRSRSAQIDNRITFGRGFTLGVLAAYNATLNHPLRLVQDSTGEMKLETLTDDIENYSIDISALVEPIDGLSVTVGAVTTYQNEIPQPMILGGYVSSLYRLGEFGTIELRFDYRETAAPNLETLFPVERVGRIITTVAF